MNIEIADRLQKLRKAKGYSQEQLADALGISRQAVSKWERAEASPDTDNLICLAKLYGVSLDDLLSTEENIEDIIKEQQQYSNNKEDNINEFSFDDDSNDEDRIHLCKKGIDIKSESGDRVHVGWDGIHVRNVRTGKIVDIGHEGIKINGYNGDILDYKTKILRDTINGTVAICAVIAYVLMGIYLKIWHPTWIVFLAIPIVGSLLEAFIKKQFTIFAYPVLVVAIYLFIGLEYELWHPYWFLFLTIPIYYLISGCLDKLLNKDKTKKIIKEDENININIDADK